MPAREPASTALEMARVIPRSLKDPVGLKPSHLRKMRRLGSVASARRGAGASGVLPSWRVTTGVLADTGRNWRKRSMMPGHAVILVALMWNSSRCGRASSPSWGSSGWLHADHRGAGRHHRELVDLGQRRAHVALPRLVGHHDHGHRFAVRAIFLEHGDERDVVPPENS